MIVPRFQRSPIDTFVFQNMLNCQKLGKDNISDKIKTVIKREIGVSPTANRHYRGAELVKARFLYMVMMVKYSKDPYRIIADSVWKDHSTVNHAKKTVSDRYDTDPQYRELYDRIDSQIKSKL